MIRNIEENLRVMKRIERSEWRRKGEMEKERKTK